MNDMRPTIIPKSDQLNADDLIGQSRTIKVAKVHLTVEADQPVAVHYEGDDGKPYKPCKSMRRVMVNIWGPNAGKYAGRSMTLYRDDKVTWGGLQVGGIRISHMSNISEPVTMALTAAKASKKPFTVQPLKTAQNSAAISSGPSVADFDPSAFMEQVELRVAEADGITELKEWWESEATTADRKRLAAVDRDGSARVRGLVQAKVAELAGVEG